MQYTRPVRGAVRLDDFHWDVEPILRELETIKSSDWKPRNYGVNWSDVALFVKGEDGNHRQHPLLADAPGLQAVLDGFPAPALDMCVASLRAGGSIKEHRDISGGVAAGVTRLHIPIRTHKDVSFFIERHPVKMAEGEVWHLDTTYRHAVRNDSDVERIHLIVDFESTPDLKAMLPKPDWRDRLHGVHFALVCVGKGVSLMFTDPKQFFTRIKHLVQLKIFRRSVLYGEDH